MERHHQKLSTILQRIALQPVIRTAHCVDSQTRAEQGSSLPIHHMRMSLSKRPTHLYELWHEYEFGLSGNKPAKNFTSAERGANRLAYSRRKAFWDLIAELVRSGYTSDVTIERVRVAYGDQLSLTATLNAIRVDRAADGHPPLRE